MSLRSSGRALSQMPCQLCLRSTLVAINLSKLKSDSPKPARVSTTADGMNSRSNLGLFSVRGLRSAMVGITNQGFNTCCAVAFKGSLEATLDSLVRYITLDIERQSIIKMTTIKSYGQQVWSQRVHTRQQWLTFRLMDARKGKSSYV